MPVKSIYKIQMGNCIGQKASSSLWLDKLINMLILVISRLWNICIYPKQPENHIEGISYNANTQERTHE